MNLKHAKAALLGAFLSFGVAHGASAQHDAAQANNPLADITAFNIQNYFINEFPGLGDLDENQFVQRFAQPFSIGNTNWLLRAS